MYSLIWRSFTLYRADTERSQAFGPVTSQENSAKIFSTGCTYCKQYLNSAQLFKLYTGFIHPCMEYYSHIWGSSPYTSLLDRVESKAIRLTGDPSLTLTLDPVSSPQGSFSLFSTTITLVTALMYWPPVFHLQWLGHVPHGRQHLPTTIVWNSLMRELIGSVMVSSLLLPAFGTLSLLNFRLPSFKRQGYHHLRDQMAFFYYPF